MDIDIRVVWFGIANGLNSFINSRVMVLDGCKNVFFSPEYLQNKWMNFDKTCSLCFFCLFSILITLFGEEGAGLCAYRAFVC